MFFHFAWLHLVDVWKVTANNTHFKTRNGHAKVPMPLKLRILKVAELGSFIRGEITSLPNCASLCHMGPNEACT